MTADPALVQTVALSLIPGLGSRTLSLLLDRFGTPDGILAAPRTDLLDVPRIGPKLATAIRAVDLDRTRADLVRWQAGGVRIARRDDTVYPRLLRALDDAPPVLFYTGDLRGDEARTVAIVGTRRPTIHARRTAEALAGALAACGCTVISGLATGIDTAAHRGALAAGGRTLAVLGSGIQAIYPPSNTELAQQIVAQGGALLCEVAPDAAPTAPALVARNRIISGLSRAVIVVEAGESSGSLHAARFATTQDRPVYAVTSLAPGNRQLLALGARSLPADLAAWEALAEDLAHAPDAPD